MRTRRRLVAVINASAGEDGKNSIADRLAEVFRSDEIEARVVLARNGEEVAAMARAAVRERPHVIVAGGGDGTINAVASEVVGTNIALGVLPLGTLNHFAKALHLPLDVEEAARIVLAANVIAIDVAKSMGASS